MKITKLGHCCLVIEINGLTILTDPGMWTTEQNQVKGVDVVLITHEHADHLHLESLKIVLANNPQAAVYTNTSVGKILAEAGISHQVIDKGATTTIKDVLLESFECPHEPVYLTVPMPQNTGYRIDGKLFYPGDSFTNPHVPVEFLALPVAGPWLRLEQAVDFAKLLKPKKCFPIHDGMLKIFGPFHEIPNRLLAAEGIDFVPLLPGDNFEF